MRQVRCLSLLLVGLLPLAAVADDYPIYNFSGSFKSLLSASRAPLDGSRYESDLNRLKLDFDARLNDVVQFKAVVDNEFLLGSVIDTTEFQAAKTFRTNTRWDLTTLVVDNDDLVWRASVYRVYLKLAFDKANVVAGRQRIAWGTGRVWNPTDLFNPISPLRIEQAQRDGVDALSAEYFIGKLSSVNLVYAAGSNSDRDSVGVRLGTNWRGYDFAFMAGDFRQDTVVGADFGGSIGDAGFRGEATYTDPDQGRSFTRLVLSTDYSWPNTLYLLLEYLHNGGNLAGSGVADIVIEGRQRFFDGEIVTRNKNFVATGIGYEFTPLVRIDGLAIYDVDDKSWFVTPSLGWNIRQNLDFSLGVQLFSGDNASEYGDKDNVYYTSIKVYF